MTVKEFLRQKGSKKYLIILLLSILLLIIIGGVVFASIYISKANNPSNTEKVDSIKEDIDKESFENIIAEPEDDEETLEELEEVPDFEGDEVFVEEIIEEVENDEEETKKEKNTRPYYIKINKSLNTITIYELDESGRYTIPVKAIICSTGKQHH